MSKYVDELHNETDVETLRDAGLFFLGLVFLLFTIGVIFWSSF